MASDQHRALTSLVRKLARDRKYLPIEVHDESSEGFGTGEVIRNMVQMDAICFRRWGYYPTTGQRACSCPAEDIGPA